MNARVSFLLVSVVLTAKALAATGHPTGFVETPYGARFTLGTSMAWAPDGSNRLFITRQGYVRGSGSNNAAEILIIKNGTLLASPFAVVTPVLNWSECGMLGITFDPAFSQNGYVYVSACVSNTEQNIIRYTAVGDVGMQKTILMAGLPSAGDTHNGGALSIGPDGKLYFGIGDNRDPVGPDGDLTSLRAKIGRANLDGTVPNDNPFVDGTGPNNDFIWARGMRNPFTHTWQPGKNLLWVNDVGGHADQVFQVNAGQHGGWMTYGGGNQPLNHPMNYIRPVLMLMSGGPSGMAIAGSTFYDGTLFPAQYRGNYFFGDFEVPGRVLRAVLNTDNSLNNQSVFATNASGPLGLQVGPDGALYYLTYDPVEPATTGGVYRIDYTNASQSLVIDRLHVRALEGSTAVLSVRLATATATPVTVNLARSGDTDVTLSTPSLTFGPGNWNVPQSVVLSAGHDADGQPDLATLNVSATGLAAHDVEVYVTDDDTQSFVVSTSALSLAEGGMATFTVRLLTAPAATLAVTVARTSGDGTITVSSGATLNFDNLNYQTPQTVTVSAAEDADTAAEVATLTLTAAAVPARTVAISVIDNDNSAPVITTIAVTRAVAGNPYRYDVEATGLPAPSFSLPTGPTGMAINSATGVIDWVAGDAGSYPVVVRATNGVMPDGEQQFTLQVATDAPPISRLSQPQPGAVLSGFIEFFGDAFDDAAAVRAEFFVDGALVYTDTIVSDHFHYGGVNGHTSERYDTRQLIDGPHTFRMTVYDARGQSGSSEAAVTIANAGVATDAGTGGGTGGSPGTGGGANTAGGTATGGGGESTGAVGGICGCSGSPVQLSAWLAGVLLLATRRKSRAS
jgi:glucose/arabinose dehydrogenase